MCSEYPIPLSENHKDAECCDLYGEYCYPCDSEYPEEAKSAEELD